MSHLPVFIFLEKLNFKFLKIVRTFVSILRTFFLNVHFEIPCLEEKLCFSFTTAKAECRFPGQAGAMCFCQGGLYHVVDLALFNGWTKNYFFFETFTPKGRDNWVSFLMIMISSQKTVLVSLKSSEGGSNYHNFPETGIRPVDNFH